MGQINTPTLDEAEQELVKVLERKVRRMFEFTGWDNGVDEDAQKSVYQVQGALDDLDSLRRVRSALSVSDTNG